jgi:hypothetical protein
VDRTSAGRRPVHWHEHFLRTQDPAREYHRPERYGITGPNDTDFRQNIFYVAKTIENLPTAWRVEYKASSGVVTVTMTGLSSVCQDELCNVFGGGDLLDTFYCLLLTILRTLRALISL